MFNKLHDFIKGYVLVEISGNFCEKFLNLVIKRKIKLKDVYRINEDKLILKIYIKDFIKIKNIAKTSSCKVKIAKRNGLHFTIQKYRRRLFLILGIALCILMIYTMSNMVFFVEITGNKTISTDYINELLRSNGIRPFAFNNIKGSEIANNIMSQNNNIAWIGIEIDGNKVLVEIVEKPDEPDVYNPEGMYNIVSSTDGVVTDIYLKKGFPVVKTGDTVKKGQLLVSGVTDSKIQEIRYLNPEADINIITWLTAKSEAQFTKNVDNFTNNVLTDMYFEINGRQIGIIRKIPYKFYSIKTEEKSIFPGVKFVKRLNIENIPEKIVYNEKELFEIERKKLYNKITGDLSSEYEILNTDASYIRENDKLITTITCTVEGPFINKIDINE